MRRQVLMIEVDGDDADEAAERFAALVPDATVWGQIDPCEAALMVLDLAAA